VVAGVVAVLVAAYLIFSGGELRHSDLALLAPDSSFIVVANVDELNSSDLAETIRDVFGDRYAKMVDEMRKEVGFGPEDIHQVVVGGRSQSDSPLIIIVFESAPDDEQLAKLVESLRIGKTEPLDVNGHRVWSGRPRQMAMGEVRGGTMLIGPRADVERALRADDDDPSALAELLLEETDLDAPLSAVFDFRKETRAARQFSELLPRVFEHLGPVVASVEVDEGATATVRMLDADDEVVVRYTLEVDGEFLGKILGELVRAR